MLPCRSCKLAVGLVLLACAGAESDVAQRETIRFPAVGAVRVEAIDKVGAIPRVVITQESTGRQLLAVQFGDPDAVKLRVLPSPKVRFQVLQEEGLPDPLLLAAMVSCGGSDCSYETVVIGEAAGQLKVLTPEPILTLAEGGVYLGDLGAGHGAGLVWWSFIWNDGAHPDPHEYEAEILRFDSKKGHFERIQWMTSRRKYYCGEDFLLRLGLRCQNLLRTLPDFDR